MRELLFQFVSGALRRRTRHSTRHNGTQHPCTQHPARSTQHPFHVVILSATAVMSSLGGVSPRKSCTAPKMASTTSRGVLWRSARMHLQQAIGAELAADRVVGFEDTVRAEH